MAEDYGVSWRTMRYCGMECGSLPEELYERLATPETELHVIKRITSWPRRTGPQKQKPKIQIKRPKTSTKLAEAVGIMLGDGCNYTN